MLEERPTETVGVLSARPRELAAGTLVAARYEVAETLGAGGYAVVYRAHDRRLRRDVALKVLRADRLSESACIRFRREVQVTRDVAAPQLLRTFDIGDDKELGLTYLTMELVHGETLRQRLQRERLAVDEAVRVTVELLRALAVLHQKGIVHRDVKPGNVLLDEAGGVRLADFGLARHWDDPETRVTETSSLVGTVEYLSPEQALGLPVGPQSDLYALGVALFEMLAGRLPHEGASPLGTVLAHLKTPAEDVRRHRPDTPSWLATVVARLLEKSPGDRFATAEEALAVLTGKSTRLRDRFPLLRRRRSRWMLATAVALLVVATGIVVRWSSVPTLTTNAEGEIEAHDGHGRLLWHQRFADARVVRVSRWKPPRVVALEENPSGPRNTTFAILDIKTGERLARKKILDASEKFRLLGFSGESFRTELLVRDLDGDGLDEVIIQAQHITQWPSYLVLYEPRLDRQRLVLQGCGHHDFVHAVDLDSNGNVEILLTGTANCMGWKKALAAVTLVPPLGAAPNRRDVPATAPGLPGAKPTPSLKWYTLLPATACTDVDCVVIDQQRQSIHVSTTDTSDGVTLDFDGLREKVDGKAPEERQVLRQRAYIDLTEAQRLLSVRRPEEALTHLRSAGEAAAAAGEVDLSEWIRRLEAQATVAAGRPTEAEALIRPVIERSESPSDAAFDLATALHVAGLLDAAVFWYDLGLGQAGGRPKFEYIFGIVLVLAESDRWEDARKAIERYEGVAGYDARSALCYAYLDWRRGELFATPPEESRGWEYDLYRYWRLEFRRANGEGPQELLPDIADELLMTSEEYRALVRALQAELLAEDGHLGEALSLVRQAHSEALNDVLTYPVARSHLDIVFRRRIAIERAAGYVPEADQLEDDLRRWQAEQTTRRHAFRPSIY